MKIYNTFLVFYLLPFIVFSQQPYELEWANSEFSRIIPYVRDVGNLSWGEGHKIKLDSRKNTIVSGTTFELGPTRDIEIMKYSSSGNLLWKHILSYSDNREYLGDLVIDEEDNVLISVHSRQSDSISESRLIKFDIDGRILWETEFLKESKWSFPFGMVEIPTIGYVLTGFVKGDTILNSISTVLISHEGNIQWENIFSLPETYLCGLRIAYLANEIQVLGDGFQRSPRKNSIITLKFDLDGELIFMNKAEFPFKGDASSSHIDQSGNSYLGFFGEFSIVKANENGELDWEFGIPRETSAVADIVNDIETDIEGNVYFTGGYFPFDKTDTLNFANGDLVGIKLSPEGDLLYQYSYGQIGKNAYASGNSLSVNSNKTLLIGGQFQDSISGNYDFLIIALDSLGNPLDTLIDGSADDDVIKSVILEDNNNIYLTGNYNGSTLTQKYSKKGINNVEVIDNQLFKFYPNPTMDILNFDFKDNENNRNLFIFNQAGRLVRKEANLNSSFWEIEIDDLSTGLYFFKITSKSQSFVGKFIRN